MRRSSRLSWLSEMHVSPLASGWRLGLLTSLQAILSEITVVRTKHAITIVSQYPTRHVQVCIRQPRPLAWSQHPALLTVRIRLFFARTSQSRRSSLASTSMRPVVPTMATKSTSPLEPLEVSRPRSTRWTSPGEAPRTRTGSQNTRTETSRSTGPSSTGRWWTLPSSRGASDGRWDWPGSSFWSGSLPRARGSYI